jgi:hypothetical protein
LKPSRRRFVAPLALLAIACTTNPYAPGASSPLANWLPRVGNGFEPSNRSEAAWSPKYDYFLCGSAPLATATPFGNFAYAAIGCAALERGTYLVYGDTEPVKGHILYDSAHRIVLYQEGCCAWRNTALASGIGAPPSPVKSTDLSEVRTQRGVTLGMTESQVTNIYGEAAPHAVSGADGVKMLSYTTMHGNPSAAQNACGQFQNFAFRDGRLYYIELLAGC